MYYDLGEHWNEKGNFRDTTPTLDRGVIALHTDKMKKRGTLTTMLDYIKFEGEGFGRIEVQGTISGSTEIVTEVDLQFNARDRKSPVTIGIYDIKPKDGYYKFENRSNQIVARVNELIFKKSDRPHMELKLASISTQERSDGSFGSLKGAVANSFIKPTKVDKLGNDTMLNLGYALLKQNPTFTFPKAKNLKENVQVAADHTQK